VGRISDHFPVLYLKEQSRKHAKSKPNITRDLSAINIARFSEQLSTTSWRGITGENDPDLAFNNFSHLFKTIHDNFFTPKITRFNKNIHKKNPWMSQGLLNSRNHKFKLAKLCLTSPSPQTVLNYKMYCNQPKNFTLLLFSKLIQKTLKKHGQSSTRLLTKNLPKIRSQKLFSMVELSTTLSKLLKNLIFFHICCCKTI
jgi:hypothetical protein